MKNLEKWFFAFWVTNYKISFLFIFLIAVAWAFSLYTIPKESSPDIKFGIISIFTSYPWVNPVDIDSLITEKIEKEIKDIDGIKKISSSSSIWASSVNVELYNWVNSRDVMTDIKDKVDTIVLPEDAEDPSIQEISTENQLMFEALLYWPREKFSDFYLKTEAKKIQSALEWRDWIVSIDIWWLDSFKWSGAWWWADDYEIKVLISKEKLENLGLSLSQIAEVIRAYNKNTPLWNYTIWDLNYDFRISWEFQSIDELRKLTIRNVEWSKIKLSDIADIKKEYDIKEIKSLGFYEKAWYNYTSIVFNKAEWANVFDVSDNAKKLLEEYVSGNPSMKWMQIKYTKDMSELIIEDYKNLSNTWISTIILVFITILIFIWFRESLIASFLLPLSFLVTFIVLDTLWLSLNFLTNFSLVLTLWIAIDTIIVIIEWASERQRLWYSRKNAILLAVKDLKSPLISWTMTTLVAFLPLMFLPGIMWKFLSYIPTTVFSTLSAALILSLTVSAALFLKLSKSSKVFSNDTELEEHMDEDEKKLLELDRKWKVVVNKETITLRQRFLEKLSNNYSKILRKFLSSRKSRLTAIFIPLLLLIVTFVTLSPLIWFIVFPSTDNSIINITIKAKTWTDKDALKTYLTQIDEYVSKYPEMKVFYSTLSWNSINVYVELISNLERQDKWLRTVFEIETLLKNDIDNFRSYWLNVETSVLKDWPPWVKAVWIKLVAIDNKKIDSLKDVSVDFENYLKTLEWAKNVWTTSTDNPGQFVFKFNKNKLDSVWLTPNDILFELYAYTFWVKAWSIKSTYEDNNIVLKVENFDKTLTPNDINNLIINTKVWKIRVWDFVDYSFDKSLSAINREDSRIIISAESDVEEWILPAAIQPQLDKFAEDYNYPAWISYSAGWENEENKELIISVGKSFFISLFLIFSILVFQFNSYLQPLIILYSVILAFLWVNIWLYFTGYPYSMPFAIWFIALTWVVVNDAIILVDRTNKELAKRKSKLNLANLKTEKIDSIVLSWKSRLQPIIVTTLTTVFWVLPLALQDAFWWGLGYTIIFGLFAWSTMTLFVIPALYYNLFYREKEFKKSVER